MRTSTTAAGMAGIGRARGLGWRLLCGRRLASALALAAVLTLAVTVTGTALAVPGGLDPTFNGTGMQTTDFSTTNSDAGNAVAVQPDGRIVVAGYAYNGSHRDFALARYNPDGSLDTGFHGDGKLVTDFNGRDDIVYGIAIQSDGKIVVAGNAYGDPANASNRDFALARYNPNGTLDTGFDTDGKLVTDFGSVGESAYSVAIQPDGKIVAAGYTGTGGFKTWNDFALARYNPNGTLDTTFDTDGKATADIFVKDNVAYGVAIQPDGKIVLGGSTGTGVTGYDFALARFNPNGALDTGFGAGGNDGDGVATTDIFVKDNAARSVALQPDGKIVLGGYAYNGSHKDFALARYNADGSLDAGFGTGDPDGDGRATADFFGNIDEIYGIALQPDGKIVAAGSAYEITAMPHDDFALARFNASGTLDAGFGIGGKADTDFLGDDDVANGVALQPDGKIVAAGSASDGSQPAFAVARYAAADSPQCSDGKDNDSDGKIDFGRDPGCTSATDANETGTPALSVGNASVVEGDSGTKGAVFTFTRSGDTGTVSTVSFATADATARAPGDYTAKSGSLSFQSGQTKKTVTIAIRGDTRNETNETFKVNLSGARSARIADATAIGTIRDND